MLSLCKYYNWDVNQILALGDGANDVHMLQYVVRSILPNKSICRGLRSVGMKNGSAEARLVSTHISDYPAREGGWGRAITRLL